MRIEFRIGIGVVYAVKNGINPRTHVRRALCDIGINKEEFFPTLAHGKCPVSCIPMVKKRLCKKRQIPVENEEKKNDYHDKPTNSKDTGSGSGTCSFTLLN